METELDFTPEDYSILNALYFFPNIISPLLAGIFIEKLGGIVVCFYLSLIIASLGHVTFALGASVASKGIMFFGKALSGSMYEIIDAVMPITYLGPLFKHDFQVVVGLAQIFIRMGSVANFIASPIAYDEYGLLPAIWIASLVGVSSIVLLFLARLLEVNFPAIFPKEEEPQQPRDSQEKKEISNPMQTRSEEYDIELVRVTSLPEETVENASRSMSPSRLLDPQHLRLSASRSSDVYHDELDDKYHDGRRVALVPADVVGSPEGQGKSRYRQLAPSPADDDRAPAPSDGEERAEQREESTARSASWWVVLLELSQCHQFSVQFYWYLLAGAFLYGSIVPFWFYGSKYLQETLYCDISRADSIMSLPEGLVVVTGFPFGLLLSRWRPSVRVKFLSLAGALATMAVAFGCLLYSTSLNQSMNAQRSREEAQPFPLPLGLAVGSVVLLGTAFSLSCSLFWGIVNEVVDQRFLSQGSGLLSCGVNVLPSVLPPILSLVSEALRTQHSTIAILAAMAVCGSVAALIAANPSYLATMLSSSSSSAEDRVVRLRSDSGLDSSRRGLTEAMDE